ncbi:bicyclomycin resistance protein, putative [Talaromyces stipitatus ATCC 10500]|uniref:Bicyclomycin resistance protein, putative n=1 Tax=Talaromyces stipitatus (strain ATCC 10500 / CBS 375.48 / QM 6759 / NRRL 1006) TaxID=441959 RepID=B8MEK7_TALSN|nr:bicyclomycin resistance protein, putative [Talaromyces stipitatus ATCC 10500]EED16634.1 bicyclomycin resistance protein, putative [Talaromyces stipitatus ATCC 10500]
MDLESNETTPLLTERNGASNLSAIEENDGLPDPNVIWWDQDEDPEYPYNWPRWLSMSNCFLISAMTFLTALASSIIAPAVPQLMTEFQNENLQVAAFVVSVYILGFAAGPLIIAPLSEIYGRVPVYHVCNVGFTIFATACALSPNIQALIIFRFLNGLFGCCPATIGGGSITDMIPQERRAAVVAAYSVGALFAPIVGPMAGGIVADKFGWRWDCWLLSISGAVISIFMMFVLKETYHTVILERKVHRLRTVTGNQLLQSKLNIGLSQRAYFLRSIVRPLKMLTLSPIVIITSLFIAITYGYMYLLFTSFTEVFQRYYGFTTSNVGLCFLGLGLGSFLGVAIFSATSDKMIKRKAAQENAEADLTGSQKKGIIKPEYRLPPLPFAVLCLPVGLLIYGWTAELRLHWIVPIIGTVFIGVGQLLLYMVLQMYLIDSFTIYAASAVAAITAVRSIAGGLLPLFGLSIYDKFGVGWGNTLLAVVCLPLVLVSFLLIRYGETLRERFQVKNL